MSERRKRRRWAASEKLRIVLAGMESGGEVSELRRREGVNPTMYYGWKKKLLSSATKIFGEKSKKEKAQQERSERELARMKFVTVSTTTCNSSDPPHAKCARRFPELPSAVSSPPPGLSLRHTSFSRPRANMAPQLHMNVTPGKTP